MCCQQARLKVVQIGDTYRYGYETFGAYFASKVFLMSTHPILQES